MPQSGASRGQAGAVPAVTFVATHVNPRGHSVSPHASAAAVRADVNVTVKPSVKTSEERSFIDDMWVDPFACDGMRGDTGDSRPRANACRATRRQPETGRCRSRRPQPGVRPATAIRRFPQKTELRVQPDQMVVGQGATPSAAKPSGWVECHRQALAMIWSSPNCGVQPSTSRAFLLSA